MKTFSLSFHKDTISLKNTNEPTIVSQDLNYIFAAIKKLHEIHLKKMRVINFEAATKEFLLILTKKYINNKTNLIRDDYCSASPHSFNNWKNLLNVVMDHIIFIINVLNEEFINYIYNITVIESNINIKEHTITILIKNVENNRFLQATILLEEHIILSKNVLSKDQFSIKIIVGTKMGVIEFKPANQSEPISTTDISNSAFKNYPYQKN